jgi:hypothetical protein
MPTETICIPVPVPEGEAVEMEVTVGGTKLLMQYRVEHLAWRPGTTPDERIDQLRDFIQAYDDDWSLVQVGSPGPDAVPVTFRRLGKKPAEKAERNRRTGPSPGD